MDWFPLVPPVLEFVVLLAAFVAALYALKKTVYNPARIVFNRWNSAMDTLVGYPAVMDPGSGKELKPPTPPLALRVDTLEDAMNRLIGNQEQILSVEVRLLELEQWRKTHETWSEQKWQEMQDADIAWKKDHETLHLLAHEVGKEVNKP